MQLILQYSTGRRTEAVLLAADRRTLRIVVAGERDTIELRSDNGCWYMSNGGAVEVESMTSIPGTDTATFCSFVCPRTIGAGQQLG